MGRVNEAVDEVRRILCRQAEKAEGKVFKGKIFLVLANQDKLDADGAAKLKEPFRALANWCAMAFQRQLKARGEAPHWPQPGAMQFVTFRLADAMPVTKLRIWKEEYEIWQALHPKPWTPTEEQEHLEGFVWKLENWLDEGAGSCLFAEPPLREVLEETLMHDQGNRTEHHAWVIMPNHVHLLFTACHPLELLMKSWKGITAKKIGLGSIWQKGYRDTMIRGGGHFANAVRYIRKNPHKLRAGTFTLWQSERSLAVK